MTVYTKILTPSADKLLTSIGGHANESFGRRTVNYDDFAEPQLKEQFDSLNPTDLMMPNAIGN